MLEMTNNSDNLVSVLSGNRDGEKRCVLLKIVWPGGQASGDSPRRFLTKAAQVDLVAPLKHFLQKMQEMRENPRELVCKKTSGDGVPAASDCGGMPEPRATSGIILDLDGVDYLNSAGIGSIFALRKYARANGAELVIARPRATVRRLLETVNLPALIPVTGDLDEARKQLENSLAKKLRSSP